MGNISIKDDYRLCERRPYNIGYCKKHCRAAVKVIVNQDARMSVKEMANCTGISEGSMHLILIKRFGS
jgi:hypothetical protein